jgi:hypothetical protein
MYCTFGGTNKCAYVYEHGNKCDNPCNTDRSICIKNYDVYNPDYVDYDYYVNLGNDKDPSRYCELHQIGETWWPRCKVCETKIPGVLKNFIKDQTCEPCKVLGGDEEKIDEYRYEQREIAEAKIHAQNKLISDSFKDLLKNELLDKLKYICRKQNVIVLGAILRLFGYDMKHHAITSTKTLATELRNLILHLGGTHDIASLEFNINSIKTQLVEWDADDESDTEDELIDKIEYACENTQFDVLETVIELINDIIGVSEEVSVPVYQNNLEIAKDTLHAIIETKCCNQESKILKSILDAITTEILYFHEVDEFDEIYISDEDTYFVKIQRKKYLKIYESLDGDEKKISEYLIEDRQLAEAALHANEIEHEIKLRIKIICVCRKKLEILDTIFNFIENTVRLPDDERQRLKKLTLEDITDWCSDQKVDVLKTILEFINNVKE